VSLSPEDRQDLIESRDIVIKDCQVVCLALGPYRNLTTLTAATLFLHPSCQVLNHAGNRIYGVDEIDFISDFSKEKLDRFLQFAIQLSGGGKRGDYGGSIVHSHAFDEQYAMKEIFGHTGFDLVKKKIKCLFWKESLATGNLIREKHFDFEKAFATDQRLRFLMPVRNPMDCASSNILSTHSTRFTNVKNVRSFSEVLQAVLGEIQWFETLRQAYPDRFFRYFEHSINRDMLVSMARFLGLEPDGEWLENSMAAMVTRSNYEYDRQQVDLYLDLVEKMFLHYPALASQLRPFADSVKLKYPVTE